MRPARLSNETGSSQSVLPDPGLVRRPLPKEITWRGVVARTDFIVQHDDLLLVGVDGVSSRGIPVTPLDRLNGEIAALIAAKQPQFCECQVVFVALVHRGETIDVWHCDLKRIQLLLQDHYFAQTGRSSAEKNIAPTAVVSFVIQQRLQMNFSGQTTR